MERMIFRSKKLGNLKSKVKSQVVYAQEFSQ